MTSRKSEGAKGEKGWESTDERSALGSSRKSLDATKMDSGLPSEVTLNRSIAHPTRYWETLVHLIKGNVGAGLFAMGDAYKNAGIYGGLVGTLFIGAICIYCSHLLIWSAARIRTKLHMNADPSFEETVEYCFKYGPRCYQKIAHLAGILVKIFVVVTQLGFCCVFFVFVAGSSNAVLKDAHREFPFSEIAFIMCMYVIVLFVCLIGHIKYLTPVSLAGTIFLGVGIVVIVCVMSLHLPNPNTRVYFANFTTWPLFFGTVVYAFEGIALIIPLRAEMRNPQMFASTLGVYNVGMAIVMVLFNTVGFLGYLRYGELVEGSVSYNIGPPDIPLVLVWIIKIMVALGILCSYPLQFFVASTVVYEAVLSCKRFKDASQKTKTRIALIVRGLIAIFVPELDLFISLIGAVSSTALALVFPVLCHLSLFTCPEEFHPVKSRLFPLLLVLDILALTLAAFGFSLGTYQSLSKMAEGFRERFPDFDIGGKHLTNHTF